MANGHMGRRIDESTRQRAVELVSKGNTFALVAQRLGISAAFVRVVWKEHQERLAINQEPEVPDDACQDVEEST